MRKIFTLLLLTPFLTLAQEDDDCIFDQATQTDEFVRKVPEFANYTWNSENKEAKIILSNKDTLIAYRGGCYHFALSGTLITKDLTDLENQDYWLNKALWIAERLFSSKDFQELKENIANKEYEVDDSCNSFCIYFEHSFYSDYHIRLTLKQETVELEIGYYFA